jgi:hypothetical protein
MTRQTKARLSRQALKAMKMAVRSVYDEHRKSGHSVYIFKDGKVKCVDPAKLRKIA